MRNYSVGEVECCAIFHGLKDLDFYVHGLKFRGLTDHRPLVGIFKKPLDLIESPCICCMVEKLQVYNMDLEYILGSFNLLADALSRMTVLNRFTREEMENHNEIEDHMANFEEHTETHIANATAGGYDLEDISLDRFFEAAKMDKDYH